MTVNATTLGSVMRQASRTINDTRLQGFVTLISRTRKVHVLSEILGWNQDLARLEAVF
jgi:hypothetical protein